MSASRLGLLIRAGAYQWQFFFFSRFEALCLVPEWQKPLAAKKFIVAYQ